MPHASSFRTILVPLDGLPLERLALGSVADKLIRAADVPVLVYRPATPRSRRRRARPPRGLRPGG